MKLLTYHTSGGKDLIIEFLDSLPKDEAALGYAILEMLADRGFEALEALDTRQIRGKLWEIKFRRKNRIFYAVVESGCVYLLHACKKQKGKAETHEIQTALQRMKEIL